MRRAHKQGWGGQLVSRVVGRGRDYKQGWGGGLIYCEV